PGHLRSLRPACPAQATGMREASASDAAGAARLRRSRHRGPDRVSAGDARTPGTGAGGADNRLTVVVAPAVFGGCSSPGANRAGRPGRQSGHCRRGVDPFPPLKASAGRSPCRVHVRAAAKPPPARHRECLAPCVSCCRWPDASFLWPVRRGSLWLFPSALPPSLATGLSRPNTPPVQVPQFFLSCRSNALTSGFHPRKAHFERSFALELDVPCPPAFVSTPPSSPPGTSPKPSSSWLKACSPG